MRLAPAAPPGGAVSSPPEVELCAFRVGEEEYAIDLRRVREILLPQQVTQVPSAPECLDGVVGVRGEVIPAVDVRRRLGLPARAGPSGKVLVVNVAGRRLALLVDAVIEVMRLPRDALLPSPWPDEGGLRLFPGACAPRERPAARGRRVARPAAPRLRLLLDVKALLDPGSPAAATAARQRAGGGGQGRRRRGWPRSARSFTALVVDDSPAIRKQLVEAVQRMGGAPVEASDGADAWRRLQRTPVDIILTDLHMPVLDGLKLTGLVRAAGRHRRTPIVVITTEDGDADRRRARALGANGYLVKPVAPEQVAGVVRQLLSGRAA